MQREPSPPSIDPSSTYVMIPAPQAAVLLGRSLSTVVRHVKSGLLEGEVVQRPQGTAYLVKVARELVEQTSQTPEQAPHSGAGEASGSPPDGYPHPSTTALSLHQLEPLFSSVGEGWVRPVLGELREAREQLAVRSELLGALRAQLAAANDASIRQQARVSELESELNRRSIEKQRLTQSLSDEQALVAELRMREADLSSRLEHAQARLAALTALAEAEHQRALTSRLVRLWRTICATSRRSLDRTS